MGNLEKNEALGGGESKTLGARKAGSVGIAPARFGNIGTTTSSELVSQSQEFVEERRSALAKIVTGIGAILGLSVVYPVVKFVIPPEKKKSEEKEKNVGKLEEIPSGTGKIFPFAGDRVYVLNLNGKLTAMSAVCTHLGCLVQWNPEEKLIYCACHGARYTTEGQIVRGPQPRPLTKYGVKVDAGDVIISKI